MSYLVTSADRDAFARCGRQWDLSAQGRRNLVPLAPPGAGGPDLGRAVREALDIYYFPGMWDWPRQITLPLVRQGLDRALAGQRDQHPDAAVEQAWPHQLAAGRDLLERYFAWAPAVDRFSPVQVGPEYDVMVLDPDHPGHGLLTPAGQPVRYRGRIGMLAVDASDAYWIVRHRVVDGDWPPTGTLLADEEMATACWAWEQFYPGMAITGTIDNELRIGPELLTGSEPPAEPTAPRRRSGLRHRLGRRRGGQNGADQRGGPGGDPDPVRQHEPSGGGRSIPQHRRLYAVAREPDRPDRIGQHTTERFRRTWIRRSPDEIAEAGRALAAAAAAMTAAGGSTRPNPSSVLCPPCAYLAPCQAMRAGRDQEAASLLAAAYTEREPEAPAEGRIGATTWGMGRGAAPPRFPGRR
ncbi:MAG TPA: hypothetical protein VGM53_03920 [Streptosporangiaceae bacterium]|jgi:hypothetical protein